MKDEIRLLQYERQSADLDKLTQCPRLSLHHVPRDKAPNYVALSYEWGEDPTTISICVDNREFRIRLNLWWCLRYIARIYDYTYLWIDAICINQDDVHERNDQVSSMGEIYRNAATVLIWLGVKEGIEMAETNLSKPVEFNVWSTDVVLKLHEQCSYWSRMWTIQEFLLARNVELVWGYSHYTWKWLYRSGQAAQAKRFQELDGVGPLSKLLFLYQKSQCSDPRDKVFALLSLLPEYERRALSEFFPDYSMSIEKVQLLAIAYLLKGARLRYHLPEIPYMRLLRIKPYWVCAEALGIQDLGVWDVLMAEAKRDERLTEPAPRFWTKELWHLSLGGRDSESANTTSIVDHMRKLKLSRPYRERREDVERLRSNWIDRKVEAMRDLASSTNL